MIALRRAHVVGERVDVDAVRALARDYPGALRELDRAPLEVLVRRRDALVRGEVPSWVQPAYDFHRWLAAALRVRRAAGRERSRDRAEIAWAAEAPFVAGSPSDLEFLLDPPSSRLSEWVLGRVAEAGDIPLEAAREAIFGHLSRGW